MPLKAWYMGQPAVVKSRWTVASEHADLPLQEVCKMAHRLLISMHVTAWLICPVLPWQIQTHGPSQTHLLSTGISAAQRGVNPTSLPCFDLLVQIQARVRSEAHWLFTCIGEAQMVLSDPIKRRAFDEELFDLGPAKFGGFNGYQQTYGHYQRSSASNGRPDHRCVQPRICTCSGRKIEHMPSTNSLHCSMCPCQQASLQAWLQLILWAIAWASQLSCVRGRGLTLVVLETCCLLSPVPRPCLCSATARGSLSKAAARTAPAVDARAVHGHCALTLAGPSQPAVCAVDNVSALPAGWPSTFWAPGLCVALMDICMGTGRAGALLLGELQNPHRTLDCQAACHWQALPSAGCKLASLHSELHHYQAAQQLGCPIAFRGLLEYKGAAMQFALHPQQF